MYWQLVWPKSHHDGPRAILRMSVIPASTIFSFVFWILDVLIGYTHPFFRYWLPLQAKTTATCALPYPENKRQGSVNHF
jgi:hypothetical protein